MKSLILGLVLALGVWAAPNLVTAQSSAITPDTNAIFTTNLIFNKVALNNGRRIDFNRNILQCRLFWSS